MNDLRGQIADSLKNRNAVSAAVIGSALFGILVILVVFGYYVWKGSYNKDDSYSVAETRMSEEEARLLREQIVGSTTKTIPAAERSALTAQVMPTKSQQSMSEKDVRALRAQIFE